MVVEKMIKSDVSGLRMYMSGVGNQPRTRSVAAHQNLKGRYSHLAPLAQQRNGGGLDSKEGNYACLSTLWSALPANVKCWVRVRDVLGATEIINPSLREGLQVPSYNINIG